MADNADSPSRGLFRALSRKVTGYRNKKASAHQPSSPISPASEGSESQRSQDTDVDLLEVQVSGKSARSARRFHGRPSLCQLRSAPANALVAAAEQAVADHAAASGSPPTFDYLTSSSHGSNVSSSSPHRYARSQSHMDLPRQGSEAIVPSSIPTSFEPNEPMPLVQSHSRPLQSPFAAPIRSPAAAPAVQQAPINQQHDASASSSTLSRHLSRKISNNKMYMSRGQDMHAEQGEVMLPPETAAFAQAAPACTDDFEVCFSGKSARAFRSMVRPTDLRPVSAH